MSMARRSPAQALPALALGDGRSAARAIARAARTRTLDLYPHTPRAAVTVQRHVGHVHRGFHFDDAALLGLAAGLAVPLDQVHALHDDPLLLGDHTQHAAHGAGVIA